MNNLESQKELLTELNFRRGMLLDDEWLAGVSEQKPTSGVPSPKKTYLAFVVDYLTGESLGQRSFDSLREALEAVNGLPRSWRFESTQGCGSPECGPEGKCGTQTCPKVARKQKANESNTDPTCCPSTQGAPDNL